ncbi:MAG: citrate transporter [Candidatus Amoebophilus sp. 36-38]|nr:MAG: citrate transporter [Candidatus Amoebophilus sp. 36-38]
MFRNITISVFGLYLFILGIGNHATQALASNTPVSTSASSTLLKGTDTRELNSKTITVANTEKQKSSQTHHLLPPSWLALPFIILLLMIATGPLLYESFWHKHYPKISILLSGLVISYYLFVLGNYTKPIEAIMEYIQFIALISALFMASGGILIKINKAAMPATNLFLLLLGAVLANLIGTTGASMLLIRPYIRLNQERIKIYHIVFFIFIVSNVGGALTPIGDPPLFLGFLKGVPFFWTLQNNLMPWLIALCILSIIFFWLDKRNITFNQKDRPLEQKGSTIQIVGKRNFIWLFLIVMAVFVDPNIFSWVPAIHYHGHDFSFLRELLLFGLAWFSYRYANPTALQNNAFSFGPIKEVILIFIGIFGTMIPALTLISAFAQSEAGISLISHNTLYWGSGIFSSVLDNAPTYLNFVAASMASQGGDILQASDVYHYAMGQGFVNSILRLKSISIASVFFGAMTYIGNGPNFMVKSIAEQLGVRMPPFFSYIIYFAIPFLLPILFLVWLICFYFQLI